MFFIFNYYRCFWEEPFERLFSALDCCFCLGNIINFYFCLCLIKILQSKLEKKKKQNKMIFLVSIQNFGENSIAFMELKTYWWKLVQILYKWISRYIYFQKFNKCTSPPYNDTCIRCSEDVLDVFWTSNVYLIYFLCSGGMCFTSVFRSENCHIKSIRRTN